MLGEAGAYCQNFASDFDDCFLAHFFVDEDEVKQIDLCFQFLVDGFELRVNFFLEFFYVGPQFVQKRIFC